MDVITKIVQERQLSFDWVLLGKDNKTDNKSVPADGAKIETQKGEEIYSIPILSIRATAGSAGNILSAIDRFDTSQKIQVDKVLFKTPPKGTVRAVQIDGHSMIPMLYPDAWVLFDETSEYSGDGLYVINWQDILMVKLLQVDFATGLLHIKSANPEYQSWEVDPSSQETFRIVGRVLRTIT